MTILALDSSAVSASCAIVRDEKLVAEFFINSGLTHSQTLMPMVQSILQYTGILLTEIDLLAVASGPGSFTGVRIGVSAVKGLAMADRLPCAGVSTLEAIAYNFTGFEGIVCAAMDARCNQVYNALFAVGGGKVERMCSDRAIAVADLEQQLAVIDGPIVLAGDGAALCHNAFEQKYPGIALAQENVRFQRSFGVALAAKQAYDAGLAVTADTLVPSYLRLPQAERELKKKALQEIVSG